jgi:hypothetical protein
MYVPHQMLTVHQDELLRQAADWRLAHRVSRASAAVRRRPGRSRSALRALRLARPASQV